MFDTITSPHIRLAVEYPFSDIIFSYPCHIYSSTFTPNGAPSANLISPNADSKVSFS